MKDFPYLATGIVWAMVCLGIGIFIRRKEIGRFSQAKIGFLAIILTYLCGLGILAVALLC